MTSARLAWDRLDAACSGLLARKCRSHPPYMGCSMDCNDVENALTPELAETRPLIVAMLDELDALRAAITKVREHPLQSYDAHPSTTSTGDRQWQIGFTDGLREASRLLGREEKR